jgi:hypothetical protein
MQDDLKDGFYVMTDADRDKLDLDQVKSLVKDVVRRNAGDSSSTLQAVANALLDLVYDDNAVADDNANKLFDLFYKLSDLAHVSPVPTDPKNRA